VASAHVRIYWLHPAGVPCTRWPRSRAARWPPVHPGRPRVSDPDRQFSGRAATHRRRRRGGKASSPSGCVMNGAPEPRVLEVVCDDAARQPWTGAGRSPRWRGMIVGRHGALQTTLRHGPRSRRWPPGGTGARGEVRPPSPPAGERFGHYRSPRTRSAATPSTTACSATGLHVAVSTGTATTWPRGCGQPSRSPPAGAPAGRRHAGRHGERMTTGSSPSSSAIPVRPRRAGELNMMTGECKRDPVWHPPHLLIRDGRGHQGTWPASPGHTIGLSPYWARGPGRHGGRGSRTPSSSRRATGC